MTISRQHFIGIGPLLAFVFYLLLCQLTLDDKVAIAAGITLLTVIWWVTEALPIPATLLVPFASFPLFGIVDQKTVA